jgi:putative transposase
MRHGTWNLRSRRSLRVISAALAGVQSRVDFGVVELSVQGNHIHFLLEAEDEKALSRGMQALNVRIAKGMNRMMERRGAVLEERYHVHVLATPSEVRSARSYILKNLHNHARSWGEQMSEEWVDWCSSEGLGHLWRVSVLVAPRTWLLRQGWKRAGRTARPAA